jgi:hypothetical protein
MKLDDLDINNEEEMKDLYDMFVPAGSGPLGVMKVVRKILEAVARDKGFDLK